MNLLCRELLFTSQLHRVSITRSYSMLLFISIVIRQSNIHKFLFLVGLSLLFYNRFSLISLPFGILHITYSQIDESSNNIANLLH